MIRHFSFLRTLALGGLCLTLVSCTGRRIVEDREARFKDINDEFSKVVQVTETKTPPPAKPAPVVKPETTAVKEVSAPPAKAKQVSVKQPEMREPPFEDSEGFDGRRPLVDPYRPGERVVLSVNYFNVAAGDLVFETLPEALVNGARAYHFRVSIKSSGGFSMFYSVDNKAETFMDFMTLRPITLTIDATESSRIKESRTFFDWNAAEATQWEKVIKRGEDEKKRKRTWEIHPFSQNIISAIYYLRSFQLIPGKKFEFRVADDGKNYTFNGEVLRREELDTAIGKLKTVVVKPTFELDDKFKPTGENLFWLTDDDRKHIVRIESKIKIGTLVGKLKSLR